MNEADIEELDAVLALIILLLTFIGTVVSIAGVAICRRLDGIKTILGDR